MDFPFLFFFSGGPSHPYPPYTRINLAVRRAGRGVLALNRWVAGKLSGYEIYAVVVGFLYSTTSKCTPRLGLSNLTISNSESKVKIKESVFYSIV